MKRINLNDMTVDQLVECFAAIALDQDRALLRNEIRRFNRLFDEMEAVKENLRTRDGDQRLALLRLYDHPNAQVRLKAAKATLAIAPDAARRTLQGIVDSREYPQAGDAGMTLDDLDAGSFEPS
jgi:hypothetical protein